MGHSDSCASDRATERAGNGAQVAEAGQGSRTCPMIGALSQDYFHLFGPRRGESDLPSIDSEVLNKIGKKMTGTNDPESSDITDGIPAGYTYLGQFIVHDLTSSNPVRRNAGGRAPRSKNLRSPRLDLDSLYGAGPERDFQLYQRPFPNRDDRYLFRLGKTAIPLNADGKAFESTNQDLPRIDTSSRGIMGNEAHSVDPIVADIRNDDNLLLSQLSALFLRVHNHVALALRRSGKSNQESFVGARHFVLRSYQKIVVHDFLRRFLHPAIGDDFFDQQPKLFDFSNSPEGLPLEFVFGAGRIGHALVRANYRINKFDAGHQAKLEMILDFSSLSPGQNLPVPADWVVDWGNFFEVADATPQYARLISPFWARPITTFRNSLMDRSLVFRDLTRSDDHNVLSGQDCARALQDLLKTELDFDLPVLSEADMVPRQTIPPIPDTTYVEPLAAEIGSATGFNEHTPLLYYLIQESVLFGDSGQRLGPLGSYIMAFTIGAALFRSMEQDPEIEGHALAMAKLKRGVCTMPSFISVLNIEDAEVLSLLTETT